VVIVDSSVWIDFLNGVTNPETQWLDLQFDSQRIGLTTTILTEVLQGFSNEKDAALVQAELLRFEVLELHDVGLAISTAAYYRELRRKGLTVRTTVDLLIAAYCIRDSHVLLHRDRDFDILEKHLGLQVVHA